MARKNKQLEMTANVLLIAGGINWGLTVFNYNLVDSLLGGIPFATTVVYSAVGLSAVYKLIAMFK